ncbi:hypothetical protein [Bacillus methanolicus]|uniref:hypothetical protein n=1 Tax=Bacillus methanolicus TaxID=1471 RepID=UPI0023807C5C|nr:hypothetical protein [Bacillus methanolicus]
MAVPVSDIKSKLNELKKRVKNKTNNTNSKRPSKSYLKELEENAELLYNEQIKTME